MTERAKARSSKESEATLDLYGINKDETDDFGRQWLLARRFAEAGGRSCRVAAAH